LAESKTTVKNLYNLENQPNTHQAISTQLLISGKVDGKFRKVIKTEGRPAGRGLKPSELGYDEE
jgi:hypothetical protein